MAAINNLYPPIVSTYIPAFLINSDSEKSNICKIHFALSSFNSISDIQNVQVTVRNQNTNLSALNPNKYPSEVMITDIKIDDNISGSEKYYIEMKPSDMINDNFVIDQYYKVQIRFTGVGATPPPITEKSQPIDEWLTNNALYFSEWSTITLIRGISVPLMRIYGYTEGGTTDIPAGIVNISLTGKLTFADEEETETMKSYQVTFYDNKDNLLMDSGVIYTSDFSNPNEINYDINYEIQYGYTYYFDIEFITQNLFRHKGRYYVFIEHPSPEDIDTEISVEMDEENARSIANITRDTESYTGRIAIRRTDSKTQFTVWEDMHYWDFDNVESIDLTWYDYTIESGIWYKYAVQEIDTNGGRSKMKSIENPLMILFDDIFLTSGNEQLRIRFNPQIASYRRTISENRTETIGSKYPYIRRNANINYVQFPLAGLIASAMDETGLFTTREDTYKTLAELYADFNEENEIPDYRDYIYEKFFRDKVLDFLYKYDVKLFRSPTEGNLLVRLMDVQLQPNQTLGRLIWNFSSNAFEVDECNLTNLEKYGILEKGEPPVVEESIFEPIRRIVVIYDPSEFPATGLPNVLYIYKRQLYIWDEQLGKYTVVSIPYWEQDPESIIAPDTGELAHQNLYVHNGTLYQYNAYSEAMEPISEMYYNQEFFEGGE